MTTLTLSAEESAPRSSSNGLIASQVVIAAVMSPRRSAASMASGIAGATLTRPEVNPWAPTAHRPGAVSSARPASQVNPGPRASRAAAANRTGSRTPYLTPITFGQLSPSRAISGPSILVSRMYSTTPVSGTARATAWW